MTERTALLSIFQSFISCKIQFSIAIRGGAGLNFKLLCLQVQVHQHLYLGSARVKALHIDMLMKLTPGFQVDHPSRGGRGWERYAGPGEARLGRQHGCQQSGQSWT